MLYLLYFLPLAQRLAAYYCSLSIPRKMFPLVFAAYVFHRLRSLKAGFVSIWSASQNYRLLLEHKGVDRVRLGVIRLGVNCNSTVT